MGIFVEREVSRSTTVNYNYPWLYYYPVVFVARTNRASCDVGQSPKTPPPKSVQPQNPVPPMSTAIQRPTDKPFLPAVIRAQSLPSQNRPTWSGGFQPLAGGVIEPAKRSPAVWVPPGS